MPLEALRARWAAAGLDDAEQFARALAGLERDGLITATPEGYSLPAA